MAGLAGVCRFGSLGQLLLLRGRDPRALLLLPLSLLVLVVVVARTGPPATTPAPTTHRYYHERAGEQGHEPTRQSQQ